MAKAGYILINGGKTGIMQAVSEGAKHCGGFVIGILPEINADFANHYCDVNIPCGIGYARNLVNVLSGDTVIAIGGGAGTLNEMAYAWQFGKKIFACTQIPGWAKELAGKRIDERRDDYIIPFYDANELQALLPSVS